MTVPELFAKSRGLWIPRGGRRFGFVRPQGRCYYCGAVCDGSYSTKDYVRSSFTGRDGVFAPGSSVVCGGCVACLDEKADIVVNGQLRTRQKTRVYCWVLTETTSFACTKGDLQFLRDTCLSPPKPPFAVVLTEGKKQLLYRSPVSWAQDPAVVQLETESIEYRQAELGDRLQLCKQVAAATGKPHLTSTPTQVTAFCLADLFGDEFETILDRWESVWEEPLTRLAAWLCPNREECRREYAA